MIDFELTETQTGMVRTAEEFGRGVLAPAEVALDRMAPEEAFKSEVFWNALGQAFALGFTKMALPEEFGGLGLDPQTTGMVWEEIGRWAPGFGATLVSAAVVPQLIVFLARGNQELVDKYVRPFCADNTGRRITAWCSSEPEVGSDGKNYYDPRVRHRTTAVKKGDRWVLNGTKSDFISNGGIACVYVVFACVKPELGLRGSGTFVVPADAPGVSRGRTLDKVGLRVLNQTAVHFEDVEIPANYQIFEPGDLYPMLHNSIVTVGNLGVGYLAVGLMRAAYAAALAHAKVRVQWGRPIFEHQLIAGKLFDIHTAIETARHQLWKASWLSKKQFPGDLKTSITARVYASEQAARQCAEMVQVFGGYGISKEYPVEKYARDATLLRIMDGTNETLMLKAASLLE